MTGFAGGCRDDLFPGVVALADPLLCEPQVGPEGERRAILPDADLAEAAMRAAAAVRTPFARGPGVTVSVLAATARVKRSLYEHRAAIACEMEAYWIAKVARARGVPFLGVRAVLDPVGTDLPRAKGLGEDSLIRVIARSPSLLGRLPGLAWRFARARRSLGRFFGAFLRELAGGPAGGPAKSE